MNERRLATALLPATFRPRKYNDMYSASTKYLSLTAAVLATLVSFGLFVSLVLRESASPNIWNMLTILGTSASANTTTLFGSSEVELTAWSCGLITCYDGESLTFTYSYVDWVYMDTTAEQTCGTFHLSWDWDETYSVPGAPSYASHSESNHYAPGSCAWHPFSGNSPIVSVKTSSEANDDFHVQYFSTEAWVFDD